ncbi:MAG: hypothetical protein HFH73_05995 [Lachnospiraceae bacterium]|jgi:hypothetical protein|nr:hypothetical protein [Lachnospiraceae bacterium]
MIFPKDVFRLNGYNGEILALSIREVKDCLGWDGAEDGYELICSLEVSAGCYHAFNKRYYTSDGALYQFKDELKECYKNSCGTAHYKVLQDDTLCFSVQVKNGVKSLVKGIYQDLPEVGNALHFEFETETEFFFKVIEDIERLEGIFYGEHTKNEAV